VRTLAASIAADVVKQVLKNGMDRGTILNVNIPGVSPTAPRHRSDAHGLAQLSG
jgi:broad specificity polyphosphatase/5'/3'-nucleotidase SurE